MRGLTLYENQVLKIHTRFFPFHKSRMPRNRLHSRSGQWFALIPSLINNNLVCTKQKGARQMPWCLGILLSKLLIIDSLVLFYPFYRIIDI